MSSGSKNCSVVMLGFLRSFNHNSQLRYIIYSLYLIRCEELFSCHRRRYVREKDKRSKSCIWGLEFSEASSFWKTKKNWRNRWLCVSGFWDSSEGWRLNTSTFSQVVIFLKTQFFNPLHSPLGIFSTTKGGQTEVTFATGSEASAGSADDLNFVQELVKKFPGTQIMRRF